MPMREASAGAARTAAPARPIRRTCVERLADNLVETARELERLGGEDELDSERILALARYAARAARRIARRSGWRPKERVPSEPKAPSARSVSRSGRSGKKRRLPKGKKKLGRRPHGRPTGAPRKAKGRRPGRD